MRSNMVKTDESDLTFNSQFDDWEVTFLRVESLTILCLYIVLLVGIADTMRIHGIFHKCDNTKSYNLYKFYFYAIFVTLGRFLSLISMFAALEDDSYESFDIFNRFNYGFYTATFSIILIAASQVVSILMTFLRADFINRYMEGLEPDDERVNKKLFWLSAAQWTFDAGVLIYFAIMMVKLYDYYNSTDRNNKTLTSLNLQLGYFIGVMMLVASFLILFSYLLMRRAFIKSTQLKGSHYKDTMQKGFLIIALAYVIRAVYSMCFRYYGTWIEQRFYKLSLQVALNFLMDLPVILVVLVLNRNTVKLRQIL